MTGLGRPISDAWRGWPGTSSAGNSRSASAGHHPAQLAPLVTSTPSADPPSAWKQQRPSRTREARAGWACACATRRPVHAIGGPACAMSACAAVDSGGPRNSQSGGTGGQRPAAGRQARLRAPNTLTPHQTKQAPSPLPGATECASLQERGRKAPVERGSGRLIFMRDLPHGQVAPSFFAPPKLPG